MRLIVKHTCQGFSKSKIRNSAEAVSYLACCVIVISSPRLQANISFLNCFNLYEARRSPFSFKKIVRN